MISYKYEKKFSDSAKKIMEYLGCECEVIPSAADDKKLMDKYLAEYRRGLKEGFTPVIIIAEEVLADWFDDIVSEGKTPEQYRKDILAKSSEGGEQLIKDLDAERYEEMEEDDFDDEEIMGEVAGGEPLRKFISYRSFDDNSVVETILAYIPTTKPYEVFAWLPFGGWNECPDAENMIKIARYWFEKHNAVPVVIGHDTVEFQAPDLDKKTAIAVAKEHYAVCPDIVDQGVGTIGALADSLTKSIVWYFWWD